MAKGKITQKKPAISKVNRQITIGFVLVTIILVIIIGYFSLSRANIYLTPKKNQITIDIEPEILPEVSSTLTSSNILPGTIQILNASATDTFFPATTTTQTSKVGGEVTIINDYSQAQTLVATTRLLSPAGILFRTVETVVVPAGQKLTVKVAADQLGDEYLIGPTKFTIPGLWEGLQNKIYAISDTPMSKQVSTKRFLQPADLENAKQELLKRIIKDSETNYGNPDDYRIIKAETLTTQASHQAGAEIDDFSFTVTAKITLIQFTKNNLQKIVENNLKIETNDNQEYLSFDPDSINYKLISLDAEGKSATISVNATGLTSTKIENLYNKKDILGFSKPDVEKYFSKIEGVETVKVIFSPSWVKSVPPLADHIIIEIIK